MFSITIMDGAELKKRRAARGWTIERLAERSGVSAATISLIEQGKRDMSAKAAIKLDAALSSESE